MTKIEFYREILSGLIPKDMSPDDVLLYAVVLHTHRVELAPNVVLDDANQSGPVVLSPLTRHSVAEVLASLWKGDRDRGAASFWFGRYCDRTPYEVVAELPQELRAGAESARTALEGHPMVSRVVED